MTAGVGRSVSAGLETAGYLGCDFEVWQQARVFVLLDAAAEFCLAISSEFAPASTTKWQDLKRSESGRG